MPYYASKWFWMELPLVHTRQSESVLQFQNVPHWEYSELRVSLGLFYSYYGGYART
jgi:hypothetical protein